MSGLCNVREICDARLVLWLVMNKGGHILYLQQGLLAGAPVLQLPTP